VSGANWGAVCCPGLDGRFPHTAVLLQGGEAAAALLSQLDQEPGGEDDYVWNIKVRRCSSARLTIPNICHICSAGGVIQRQLWTRYDSADKEKQSGLPCKAPPVRSCYAFAACVVLCFCGHMRGVHVPPVQHLDA